MAEGVGGLGLYGRLVGQSVRAQLQYRWSFLLMAFGNMVTSGVEVIGIWALFDRFGSLGAWRLAEVAFLYGLVNAAFAVAEVLALAGTTESAVSFGDIVKPEFTVCSITRWRGAHKRRILQAEDANDWLHGHHEVGAGVAIYGEDVGYVTAQ